MTELTTEEKSEFAELMLKVHNIIKPLADETYGERGLQKMRQDIRNGKVKLPQEHQALFDQLVASEPKILGAYIRVATRLVKSFHMMYGNTCGMDIDDFWQEASVGICNAMYAYNGTSEFTTLTYCAVKNRLIQVVKKLNSPKVMADDTLPATFADASHDRENTCQEMQEIIKNAPLSEQERKAINFCLSKTGSKGWQLEFAQLNACKPQRVSQLYLSAKNKIHRYSERMAA